MPAASLSDSLQALRASLNEAGGSALDQYLAAKAKLDNQGAAVDANCLMDTMHSLTTVRALLADGLRSGLRNDAPDSSLAMRQRWRLAEIRCEDYFFVLLSQFINVVEQQVTCAACCISALCSILILFVYVFFMIGFTFSMVCSVWFDVCFPAINHCCHNIVLPAFSLVSNTVVARACSQGGAASIAASSSASWALPLGSVVLSLRHVMLSGWEPAECLAVEQEVSAWLKAGKLQEREPALRCEAAAGDDQTQGGRDGAGIPTRWL